MSSLKSKDLFALSLVCQQGCQQGSDQRKNLILFRKRLLNALLARLKIHFQGNNQQYKHVSF